MQPVLHLNFQKGIALLKAATPFNDFNSRLSHFNAPGFSRIRKNLRETTAALHGFLSLLTRDRGNSDRCGGTLKILASPRYFVFSGFIEVSRKGIGLKRDSVLLWQQSYLLLQNGDLRVGADRIIVRKVENVIGQRADTGLVSFVQPCESLILSPSDAYTEAVWLYPSRFRSHFSRRYYSPAQVSVSLTLRPPP